MSRDADEPNPDNNSRSAGVSGRNSANRLIAVITTARIKKRRRAKACHSPVKCRPTINPTVGRSRCPKSRAVSQVCENMMAMTSAITAAM